MAEKLELTNKQTAAFLETLAETAVKETKKNGEFTIPGIGKLVKAERKARLGRNPQTGETIKIKAKTVVKFRVAKVAKDSIARPRSNRLQPSPSRTTRVPHDQRARLTARLSWGFSLPPHHPPPFALPPPLPLPLPLPLLLPLPLPLPLPLLLLFARHSELRSESLYSPLPFRRANRSAPEEAGPLNSVSEESGR